MKLKMIVCSLVAFLMMGFAGMDLSAQKSNHIKSGIASFYHNKFVGRKTASGEVFSNNQYTAASNHYPLGTYLKVTNTKNGKVVYVKVNDRMGHPKRVIDLTHRAAKDLNFTQAGITQVNIEVVDKMEGQRNVTAQIQGRFEDNVL
ncbi:MAG TPA: septal ring lytic transglycosylase RlpA family protein [Edaphocola sp.]|nr:septal ring lytic transglycosylase RlpA family protein [Edaphocola sp.]